LVEPQLLSPPHRRSSIANVFAQDEIALRPNLLLTLGAKVESNSYTRAELLPNARLGWRINERQFLWAAVSRGIRDPSRIERDFVIPGLVVPGRMGSEKLVAYEAGYRGRVTDRADVSASVYLQDYDDVRTNELTPPGVLPIFVGNSIKGQTYGIEVWGDADVTAWWRLSAGASLIGRSFDTKDGKVDLADFRSVGADPPFWAKLNSEMKLSDRVDLDVGLRFYARTGDAPSADLIGVPAYLEANARLAWRVRDDLEVFVAGENLIHDQHPESVEIRREEIPRSVSVGVTWRP
jgi:iron complex outermembrane receptor protein